MSAHASVLAAAALIVVVDFGSPNVAKSETATTISITPTSKQLNISGGSGSNDVAAGNYFDAGNVTISDGVNFDAGDTTAVEVYGYGAGYGFAFVNNGEISYTGYDNDVLSFAADSTNNQGAIAAGGSFTNNGKLLGHMTSEYGDGLYLEGDLNGTVTNATSGLIKLDFVDGSSNSASGTWRAVFIDGDVGSTGSVVNNGQIEIVVPNAAFTASSAVASGEYYGIKVAGDVSGSISNTGTVSVDVDRATGLEAYGISAGVLQSTGSASNSGTISVTVEGDSSSANSFLTGVGVSFNKIYGSVTNETNGTIVVALTDKGTTGGSSHFAYGIYTRELGQQGSINNNGVIDVDITGKNGYYASAYGIFAGLGFAVEGQISNSGDILVDLSGRGLTQSSLYAYGIRASSIGASGSLENTSSGVIDVHLTASASGSKSVYGIYVPGDNLGSITNAGLIKVSASELSAYSGAEAGSMYAYGVRVTGRAGDITNSGTVNVVSSNANEGKTATAYGFYLDSDLQSGDVFTNTSTGVIDVESDASGDGYAGAVGVRVSRVYDGGELRNEGAIHVDADNTGVGTHSAYGIWVRMALEGDVINSGTVTALSNDTMDWNAYSVVTGTVNPVGIAPVAPQSISPVGFIDNRAGGTLRGNIYAGLGVGLQNAGTVWLPESANGQVAAYVSGNFVNTADGTLLVEVYGADPSEHSQLVVDGTVDIDGKLRVNVRDAGIGPLQVGDRVEDVIVTQTVGGISGNFAFVEDNSLLFKFSSVVDGDTVDLDVSKGTTVYEAAKSEGLRPAYGAAKVLDKLAFGPSGAGAMQPVIDALSTLETEKEVADAAYQTLPLLTGGASRLIRDVVTVSSLSVDDRMNGLAGQMSEVKELSRNFWIDPMGAWTQQDEMDKSSGYSSTMYGVVAGVDGNLNSAYSMGVAFAYANTTADSDSGIINNSATVNSYEALVYGLYAMETGTLLRYQIDGGIHDTEGRRNINFGYGEAAINDTARSDYSNTSFHAGASVEHGFAIGASSTFTPRFKADYISVWSEQYDEDGAGVLNLSVDSQQYQTMVLSVDGRLEHQLTDALSLQANAGVGYDVLNERSEVTAAYAGASDLSFKVEGMQTDAWMAQAGASLAFQASDDLQLSASYNAILRENFITNMAGVEVNWRF